MLEEKQITAALGGDRALGKRVQTALDMVDLIKAGLPSKSLFFLQKEMALNDSEYSSAIGVSVKTLSRYRNEPRIHITPKISDRLYRVARIFTLAEEVLEDKDAANRWLHRPQTGLGERTPLEIMQSEVGAREVEELLYRIEYGIYS